MVYFMLTPFPYTWKVRGNLSYQIHLKNLYIDWDGLWQQIRGKNLTVDLAFIEH